MRSVGSPMQCSTRRVRASVVLAVLTLSGAPAGLGAMEPATPDDAARLLATRCLECHAGAAPKGKLDLSSHSAALRGGESGPAIAPGNADASLVWKQIASGAMPPGKSDTLSAEEKALLRRWIASGAQYPTATIDRFQYSSDTRAGYDWWALQPIRRPPVPEPSGDGRIRNPIDAFVLERLSEVGLKPSPEASPRVLIRRLFFDLIGLPPRPEQVEAFVAAPSDAAYRALVEELLASPHYGERWGRHWLDVARFGESDGFERNKPRDNQWHFRDWVIRSLNADMPYTEFARLQIAGDLLEPGRDGLAAAAFLTAGVHNTTVGGSEFMKKTARQDELEEIAGTVAQTFIGLTVNCGRCHDHKFDPVTQAEYYRFVSALSGVFHGERTYREDGAAEEIERAQADLDRVHAQVEAIDAPAREHVRAQRGRAPADANVPEAIYTWEFDSDFHATGKALVGTAIGSARIEDGSLVIDDHRSYVETAPLPVDLVAKTLEVSVQLLDLDQRGGGAMSLQNTDGTIYDSVVYARRRARRWMSDSEKRKRTKHLKGPDEEDAVGRPVHLAIVYHEDGNIRCFRDGVPYGRTYNQGKGLHRFPARDSVVRFGIRHLPAGGDKHLRARIHRARLYDRALTPDEVAAAERDARRFDGRVADDEILAVLDDDVRAQRTRLAEKRKAARAAFKAAEARLDLPVDTVEPKKFPEATRLLVRGHALSEGDVMTPGAIRAVPSGVPADFGLAADASDADRRRHLAEWIAHPDNPLFARVIANRIWHYHFGTGIVETPNDFGYNGGRPSHPELLDWLSAEVAARGWSLKSLHRLIVTSATYRQSSRPDPEALAIDAANRWLWRKSPTRLEAESIRDAMLAVSGALNSKRFGPGFRDVTVNPLDGTTYYTAFDSADAEFQRRTVYRFSPRGGRSAVLDTFDCPDPATTAPRRSVTTTPLQALVLLNDDFVLRLSDRFAKRLLEDAGKGDVHAQVNRAFQLALGRPPDEDEHRAATEFATVHGTLAFARVLFNSNEFVVVE